MRQRLRRLLAGVVGLVAAVASSLVLAGAPAQAAPCTPWPSCFGTVYQVTGTPDNSLTEWTNSPSLGGTTVRSVANGTSLVVGCQANNGPQEDNEYNVYPSVPSRTWDFVYDSGLARFVWVYDWWMNTPPQNASYSWYSWPDAAKHCNFDTPAPPATPGSLHAVRTSPTTVHVSWGSVSGATYLLRSGSTTASTASTGYDWSAAYNTAPCFTVAATNGNGQSAWSTQACVASLGTTDPKYHLYCPQDDASTRTCTAAGAFQISCDTTTPEAYSPPRCQTPVNDFNTVAPNDPSCCVREIAEALAAYDYFNAQGDTHAALFLDDYTDAAGGTRTFNSSDAYNASTDFKATVDGQASSWITTIGGYAPTFDSGYIGYPADFDLTKWGDDFHYAVGHCYFRVNGVRSGDHWVVSLTITEMYQFKDGQSFAAGLVTGDDLRNLQRHGLARSIHLVGTTGMNFNLSGVHI
jgi:hypothetical protein